MQRFVSFFAFTILACTQRVQVLETVPGMRGEGGTSPIGFGAAGAFGVAGGAAAGTGGVAGGNAAGAAFGAAGGSGGVSGVAGFFAEGGDTIVWTDCASASIQARTFDDCVFETACSRMQGCCSKYAECVDASVIVSVECAQCLPCAADEECPYGTAFCSGGRCEPCPDADACPSEWPPASRNGCAPCTSSSE